MRKLSQSFKDKNSFLIKEFYNSEKNLKFL
jgi:hypothetical protein